MAEEQDPERAEGRSEEERDEAAREQAAQEGRLRQTEEEESGDA